jgi:hypothetical protein
MPFGQSRGLGFNNPPTNRIIVEGTGVGDGVFVYNGTPGPGNPPITWMTNGSLKDPFGNTLTTTMGVQGIGGFGAISATADVYILPGNIQLAYIGEFSNAIIGEIGVGTLLFRSARSSASDPQSMLELLSGSASGFGAALFNSQTSFAVGTTDQEVVWYPPSNDVSGATDATVINAFLAGNIGVRLTTGTYYINATLALPVNGSLTMPDGTIINAVAGGTWTNNMMCVMENASSEVIGGTWNGLGAAYATAIGGIGVYGVEHCRCDRITGTNLSWWTVESQGTASTANLDFQLGQVISRNCAAGVHFQGVAGSSYHSENFASDLQIQECGSGTGAGANMDALFIEDAEDVLVSSVNSGMIQGNGYNLHVKGAVATCHITNADIGGGTNAVCLVENNAGGTGPQDVWVNGTLQQSSAGYGLRITGAASELHFKCRFFRNYLSGVSVEGSGDSIDLDGSVFANNNQAGGTNYDLTVTASTIFYCSNARFRTPIGTGVAGQVPSPVNDTTHKAVLTDCAFVGSGTTVSNVFSSGGTPQIVRDCIGANPRGQVTAPTITTGTFTTSTSQYDTEVIFKTLGGMTSFSINGTVTAVLPAVGVPFHCPARSALVVVSATTAPTWQWYAD